VWAVKLIKYRTMKIKLLLVVTIFFISVSTQAQINPNNSVLASLSNSNKQSNFANMLHSQKALNSIIYRPAKETEWLWDTVNNVWNFQDSTRFTWNSAGNLTYSLQYYGSSPYPTKSVYVYNSNGKSTSDTSFTWNGTTYAYSQLDIYTYDANSHQTMSKAQNWNGTAWVDYVIQSNTWTNNELSEYAIQIDYGSGMANNVKLDFTYTGGACSNIIQYNWYGTSWVPTWNTINNIWHQVAPGNWFDSKLTSDINQIPNGAGWKDSVKDNLTYDSYGNRTEWIAQSKKGASYFTYQDDKDIYQYDANNNIAEDILQKWNPLTLTTRNYQKRDYSEFKVYIGIEEIAKENNNVTVYPNPSTGFVQLNITKKNKAIGVKEIKLVDMLGKIIWATGASNSNTFDLDITNYSQGIYYVRIINADGDIETKKLVKQ
jgi:hypothetical protein